MSGKDTKPLKVAIVCDWLVSIGGAERVVLDLHKMFPGAPIYTSQYDPKKIDWFKDADIRTTWLQKLPYGLRKFLPVLRAWSFSHLDLSEYDLVISSSGAEAKGIKTSKNTLHVNYCHSPTHYYWIRYDEYLQNPGFGSFNWLARLGLEVLVGPMRRWDLKASQRPDVMIANSTFTQANIKKYYKRDSVVIHPPVDTKRFAASADTKRRGFVTAGNQRPYMRRDLAVSACTKLSLPLKVIGNGPEHNKLKSMAGPTVEFLTNVSDRLPNYFQSAEAFIFPAKEDFGITAVEALAAGTPVIAFKGGGALDYITPGKNGLFFSEQSVESLREAIQKLQNHKFNSQAVSDSAAPYDEKIFRENMLKLLSKHES
ncbi:MAG TPA: glycosyltransferase [Candidatus Saccharimonadales bacterium]|nr:glycosyltransferase [Candidatus Saccharimonadales bacterium]